MSISTNVISYIFKIRPVRMNEIVPITHTHTHTHAHVRTCTHAHTRACARTRTHAHTHTHAETDKAMTIGKIADFSQKLSVNNLVDLSDNEI